MLSFGYSSFLSHVPVYTGHLLLGQREDTFEMDRIQKSRVGDAGSPWCTHPFIYFVLLFLPEAGQQKGGESPQGQTESLPLLL